nr:DUF11 domain-containing protein [Microbacterium resistens]
MRRNAQTATTRRTARPRRGLLAGLIVPLLISVGLVGADVVADASTPAVAAPGNPGTPGPAREIYYEGFENNTGATAVSLRNYVGAQGEVYTAHDYWLRQDQCNGVVVQYSATVFPSGFCTTEYNSRNNVRRMADVLGQVDAGVVGSRNPAAPVNGSTAATRTNHAITAWTGNVSGPNNAVTFETPPFDLAGNGTRFYTASVNVAETSCTYRQGQNNSRLNFSLVAGNQELPVTKDPIRACTDPDVRYYTSPALSGGWGNGGAYVAAGQFYADSSFLVDTAQYPNLQLRMRNAVGTSDGNDFAYDNVRLFDATPQMDKSFSPERVPVNGVSTLTFTVTNTDDLAEKRGWSFTDTLPEGLVVADPANIGGTCTANTTAAAGSGTITVADGVLEFMEESCTITVDVTSASPGPADASPVVYANCAENITSAGLDAPACAEVEFYNEPHLTLTKSSDGSGASRVGDTVTYTVTATNDGTGNYTDDNPAVVVDDLTGVLDDATLVDGSVRATIDGAATAAPTRDGNRLVWQGPLAVGSTMTLTYQVVLTGEGDDRVNNVAFPPGTPYDPENPPATPVCGEEGSVCTDMVFPGISMTKSSQQESYDYGRRINYTFTVTNTGGVPLTDITINEESFSGSGQMSAITCDATELAPDETTTCHATYTATGADVDRGSIDNTATATGTPPEGDPVVSGPDSHRLVAPQSPVLTIDKLSDAQELVAGETIRFWFVISNEGNVTVSDIAVEEVSFDGSGDPIVISCPGDTLAAYQQMTCFGDYVVTQEDVDKGTLTNTATVTGKDPGGDPVDGGEDTVNVPSDPEPGLSLVKSTPDDELIVGDEVVYWFQVRNTGNVTVDEIAVAEVAFSGSGEMSPITCEATRLPPRGTTWCSATYTVTQEDVDAGILDNTAVATGEAPDDGPVSSNESQVSIPGAQNPGLTLVKSSDTERLEIGKPVTYSFEVTNTGDVTVGNIVVSELDFDGHGTMGEIVCPSNGPLAPGDALTCTATYTPVQDDIDQGGATNTAVAEGTQPGGDPVTTPPSEAFIPGGGNPQLVIEKSASSDELVAGETITYSFRVENTGDTTLTDVTVVEGDFSGSGDLSEITCPAEAAQMAPGDVVTCTATYVVTQADVDAGSVQNSAHAQGTPPGGGDPVVSNPDDETVTADPRPGIALVKSADTDTIVAGETVTYTFVVTNTGNVTLTGILLTEEAWTGWEDEPDILCPEDEAASLAPGASLTCTGEYVVQQEDVDAGRLYNAAVANGTPPNTDTPIFSDPSEVTLTADPNPSLDLVKSTDTTELVAGETITYTFVVTNDGNQTLTDIAIREDSFTGSGPMSAITCTPEDAQRSLAPGAQLQCTATYEVTQADADRGTIDNTATATGTPPGGQPPVSSPPSEVRIPQEIDPRIALVKSSDTDVLVAGETITYSFAVTNTGNVTLTDVQIAEDAFTGSGEVSAISCPDEAASLAPGRTITCTATYTVTQADVDAGSVENTATASGFPPRGGDRVSSDPSSTEATAEPEPGIEIVKSSDTESFVAGQTITYSFAVTNTGNVTLTDVTVKEGDFDGTGELSAIECPAEASSLAPGETVTCTATYVATQADADRGSLTNSATGTGTPPGGEPPVSSPPSEVRVPSDQAPGLSVVKSADKTELVVGERITYSFVVTNTGNVTLTEVSVNESSFTGSGEMSAIECPPEAASLAPGAQVVCTATYVVTQADADAGSVENTATATGTPPGGDPLDSPPSSVRVPQDPAPGLSLVKTADPAQGGKVGDTITYSFTVTNTGNVTLTDVTVDEGEFSGTGELSEIVCPDGANTLVPGQAVTCTASYVLTQADVDAGGVTNSAVATGNPPGGEPPVTSPPSEVTVPLPPEPGVSMVKSADKTELVAGETITYSFVVTNTGNVTLTDVSVDEVSFSGTGELSPVICPEGAASLAPGAQVVCTATYVVTQADVDAGTLENTASVTGNPPGGQPPVESPPSSVRVPQDPAPGLSLVKTADPAQGGKVGGHDHVLVHGDQHRECDPHGRDGGRGGVLRNRRAVRDRLPGCIPRAGAWAERRLHGHVRPDPGGRGRRRRPERGDGDRDAPARRATGDVAAVRGARAASAGAGTRHREDRRHRSCDPGRAGHHLLVRGDEHRERDVDGRAGRRRRLLRRGDAVRDHVPCGHRRARPGGDRRMHRDLHGPGGRPHGRRAEQRGHGHRQSAGGRAAGGVAALGSGHRHPDAAGPAAARDGRGDQHGDRSARDRTARGRSGAARRRSPTRRPSLMS